MLTADDIQQFIEHGDPRSLPALLEQCLIARGVQELSFVQRLFEDMYGGMTFNLELKAVAALCLPAWGAAGLNALVEGARRTPSSKNVSLTLDLLASLASGERLSYLGAIHGGKELQAKVAEAIGNRDELARVARSLLREYVLWFDDEDDVASAAGMALTDFSFRKSKATAELFAALATRWLAVSTPTLRKYARLIAERSTDEPSFQRFFESHPQLLDPMALDVWARPDLHGFKEPDFVIRRTDDTYVIVEIETPAKTLVTRAGQIGAEVTNAVGQVTQYRSFLLERQGEATKHFPKFRDPDGLIIIGMDQLLTDDQRKVLRLENEHRSRVKVVGFDWISERATSISRNVVESRIGVKAIRMV